MGGAEKQDKGSYRDFHEAVVASPILQADAVAALEVFGSLADHQALRQCILTASVCLLNHEQN